MITISASAFSFWLSVVAGWLVSMLLLFFVALLYVDEKKAFIIAISASTLIHLFFILVKFGVIVVTP